MKTNADIIDYMYRYLEKYTGKYRVLANYDLITNNFPKDSTYAIDKSFDDLYIPCKKGVIKHTYDDYDKLALCLYDKRPSVAKSIFDEITNKYSNLDIKLVSEGNDSYIYFYDKDISKIATIIKPKTSGAKIKWNDNRNLPKVEYTIPAEDLNKYTKLLNKVPKNKKMVFIKTCNSKFLESISKKDFDAKLDAKLSRFSTKEYIHSKELWEKYIKFLNKKIKEEL